MPVQRPGGAVDHRTTPAVAIGDGAIGGATGGTTGMLLGGVGGLLPPVIQAVAVARQRVPSFLRRHYLVFERQREMDGA